MERAAALVGDDAGATELRLLVHQNRATSLWMLGQPDDAMRVLGETLALAERAGTPHRLASLRVQTAEFYVMAGRWDDALPELEAASAALPPYSPIDIMHRGLNALIGVHRNDRVLIDRYLSEEDTVPSGAEGMADTLRGARALMLVAEGRPADALSTLLRFLDPASDLSFPYLTTDKCVWMTDAIRLALEFDDRRTAEACSAACSAEAAREPLPVIVAAAAHCRGLVTADPDLIMSAASGFGDAQPLFRASALEDAAVVFAEAHNAAAARVALDDALAIYAELDAQWDLRRAEARLRHLGVRRGPRSAHRRSTFGWEALTPAEVRVATLVATGKSNPDIASELYLSRNTVQSHVSHIFVKLGCRSRTEITTHVLTATS